MRRFAFLTVCLLATLGRSADEKGTALDFDGLKSTTPAKWVKEKSGGAMRFAQFKIPKAEGDSADAEVVIFRGITGSAKANIDRWKGQFKGGDDAKTSELKVAGNDVFRLEVTGDYTPTALGPKAKATTIKGAKGIFYQFEGPENIYHIRLVGPKKTVDAYAKGYDDWVKGFKK